MKIVHLCLSCFYIDGFAYQENQLVARHVVDGHEVTVLASTESFDASGHVTYLKPRDYVGTDGARVIRLSYREIIPHRLATKIRSYPNVSKILASLKPEVLVFHGLCAWELLTAASYIKTNPAARLYVDCHEDYNNSARTFASKWGLHLFFYKPIIHYCLPHIRKILCVSQESMSFAHQLYKIPHDQLEFFPLGGSVLSDEMYDLTRAEVRTQYGWNDEHRVFIQSGKIDRAKRLTDSLNALKKIENPNIRFIIAGKIFPDVETEVRQLIQNDKRILEVGWLKPKQLQAMLCAADAYVQPGSQSATMQMSLCCRCPVILDDVPSHRALFMNNGFLISDFDSFSNAMNAVSLMPRQKLSEMSSLSAAVARKYLDYKQQALRVLR